VHGVAAGGVAALIIVNTQKRDLLRHLVKKVLVHDKPTIEI
jgi:hypothetical protein